MAEDAASVLEQFVQDGKIPLANLPAEIAHLLEEIHAKDQVVQECRNTIATRDNSIQKFVKLNGAGLPNPKEEGYCKLVKDKFERAKALQEEKCTLAEKQALLLDRQIKRLDFKIRNLQNDGAIAPDPQLPSLLSNTSLSTRLPNLSTTTTGTSTPLHPLSGNAGPSTTIANSNITRLVQPSARQPSPLNTAGLHPSTAAAAAMGALRGTNRSPSTDPSKRRRLNHHLSIPATSSLRQSSLGPGTPKDTSLAASRGSSAGPTRPSNKGKPGTRAAPPHQRIGHLNPTSTNKKTTSSSRRRGGNKKSGTPFSTGEESGGGDENDEDVEMEDADEEGDGDGDDRKYCLCNSVSYGNMVACDNDDCPHEWFHWNCVGVSKEPVGKWYCPTCKKNGAGR